MLMDQLTLALMLNHQRLLILFIWTELPETSAFECCKLEIDYMGELYDMLYDRLRLYNKITTHFCMLQLANITTNVTLFFFDISFESGPAFVRTQSVFRIHCVTLTRSAP